MADVKRGFDKSGGWRFGNGFSDLYTNLYTPEAYNAALLEKVGNPFGEKKTATPAVVTPAAEGLLSNTKRDGSSSADRSDGLAGNGTNLSDAQWSDVKAMRDQIDPTTGKMVGFSNDFDKAGFKNLGMGLLGVLSGSPMALAGMIPDMQKNAQAQMDALASFGGATTGGLLGQSFGSQDWSNAVNTNAAARQARQQQSAAEAAAIAAAEEQARKDALAAAVNGGGGGGSGWSGGFGSEQANRDMSNLGRDTGWW